MPDVAPKLAAVISGIMASMVGPRVGRARRFAICCGRTPFSRSVVKFGALGLSMGFCIAIQVDAQPFAQNRRIEDELNALVNHQEYARALTKLGAVPEDVRIDLLRRYAEAGHVPMAYELAALLFQRDVDESLKWYARGRLARTLDAAECNSPRASLAQRIQLDEKGANPRDFGVAHPDKFNPAIAEALEWNAQRSSPPSAEWICGRATFSKSSNGLKSQPERQAEREKSLTRMKVTAKAVADFEEAVRAGIGPYRLHNSGIGVPVDNGRGMGWIDNERVAFVGLAEDGDAVHGRFALFVWTPTTGAKETVVRGELVGALCVFDSYMRYDAPHRPSENAPVEQWEFGGKYPKAEPKRQRPAFRPREIDCRDRPEAPPGVDFARVRWLKEGGGYILMNKPGDAKSAELHRDGEVRVLPSPIRQISSYAPWSGSYLIERDSGDLTDSSYDAIVYDWIRPDGSTEKLVSPYGVWRTGRGSHLTPTKQGQVIVGGAGISTPEVGYAGLFLLETSGKLRRLLAGHVGRPVVSPSGCRIAFSATEREQGRDIGRGPDSSGRKGAEISPFVAVDLC